MLCCARDGFLLCDEIFCGGGVTDVVEPPPEQANKPPAVNMTARSAIGDFTNCLKATAQIPKNLAQHPAGCRASNSEQGSPLPRAGLRGYRTLLCNESAFVDSLQNDCAIGDDTNVVVVHQLGDAASIKQRDRICGALR